MKLGRQAMTTAAAVAAAMVAALAWAGPAAAQEFVKVNEAAREQIPAVPFVAAAYAFIWVAVLVYIGSVARRMVKLRGICFISNHELQDQQWWPECE